jgi:hypothetical protein
LVNNAGRGFVGQTADVPEAVAKKWIDAGWVSKAKAEPEKRATKAAPPKRTR